MGVEIRRIKGTELFTLISRSMGWVFEPVVGPREGERVRGVGIY